MSNAAGAIHGGVDVHDEEAERVFWQLSVEVNPPSNAEVQAAAMKLLDEASRLMEKCGLRLEQDQQYSNVWYFTPSRVTDGWAFTATREGIVVSDNIHGTGPRNPEVVPLTYDRATNALRGTTEAGDACSGLLALANEIRRRFHHSDSLPR